MQDKSERLGKLVRESRIKRNMTQLELAEVIDKSERTVVKIEKGEGNPKLDSLAQIVKTLKINLDSLFDPENACEHPCLDELVRELSDCTESEAAALIPVVRAFLYAVRNIDKTDV